MTPDRLRLVLGLLRWSQRGLAEALECDDRLVRRWASGHASVPPEVAAWLEALAAAHEAHPVPRAWRRRGGHPATMGEALASPDQVRRTSPFEVRRTSPFDAEEAGETGVSPIPADARLSV